MYADPGQTVNVSGNHPEVASELMEAKLRWEKEVLSELPDQDSRPFTVGHPDFEHTQLPARDGQGHGNITRSSRHPNASFFTNWTSLDDRITWDVEVLAAGLFEVEIYYTCPPEDVGATFELTFNRSKALGQITQAHNPPLRGMENDRVERIESYVKDFKPLQLGAIHLPQGTGTLALQATKIPGSQVMDFRLLTLRRIPD